MNYIQTTHYTAIPISDLQGPLDRYNTWGAGNPWVTRCTQTITVDNCSWYCTREHTHEGPHVAMSGNVCCFAWYAYHPDFFIDMGL